MSARKWPHRITVTVTADDIAKGQPWQGDSFPVALAVSRVLGADYPHVATGIIWVYLDAYDKAEDAPDAEWNLPRHARDFITRFDDSQPVMLFTFTAERVI